MFYLFVCFLAATGRYHGGLFYDSPMPGGVQPGGGSRIKSKGFHPTGFETEEEANVDCWSSVEKAEAGGSIVIFFCESTFQFEGGPDDPQVLLVTDEQLKPRVKPASTTSPVPA